MKDRHKGAKGPLTTFLWCPAVWSSGEGKEKHTLRSNEDKCPSSKTDHLGSAILQRASMLFSSHRHWREYTGTTLLLCYYSFEKVRLLSHFTDENINVQEEQAAIVPAKHFCLSFPEVFPLNVFRDLFPSPSLIPGAFLLLYLLCLLKVASTDTPPSVF